jgi:hypothetical protein
MPRIYGIAGTPDSWDRRALAIQLWPGPELPCRTSAPRRFSDSAPGGLHVSM